MNTKFLRRILAMITGRNGTRTNLNQAFAYLERGKFKAALKRLEAAIRAGDGINLERDTAAWWMFNVAKYRKEWKKMRYGNAHLFFYDEEDNNGKAWSDIEIAVVLLAPNTPKLNTYLGKFLGRSPEAIRFQRRYAHGRPLMSWTAESGERYTRYTQTSFVKNRLGV
jgi:hypothetical protein